MRHSKLHPQIKQIVEVVKTKTIYFIAKIIHNIHKTDKEKH